MAGYHRCNKYCNALVHKALMRCVHICEERARSLEIFDLDHFQLLLSVTSHPSANVKPVKWSFSSLLSWETKICSLHSWYVLYCEWDLFLQTLIINCGLLRRWAPTSDWCQTNTLQWRCLHNILPVSIAFLVSSCLLLCLFLAVGYFCFGKSKLLTGLSWDRVEEC